jgi:Zn-dependent peptidase ImmA (M78 family)/DNA-binding XRE family transcriptional regulator
MTFNPSRLGIARKRRMLNQKKLAQKLGINPHTVGLWEQGENVPTSDNADGLSRVLRYPVNFLYGPDIERPSSDLVSFRSQTSMTAALRDAAIAAGMIGFLIFDWVDARFNLPAVNIPSLHLSASDPESAAKRLRQEWGLGEKPIPNMIHLLESKGVKILSLAENTEKINAYSLWRDGKPCVFLNTFKSAECSRFDAAHELAHLVLHQDGGVTGRQAEDQANQFASAFLMPRADILAFPPPISGLQKLIDMKQRWKVSLAALAYRLHKVGLISDWKYRDFFKAMAMRGYNKREPNEIERERSSVLEKVLKSLWAEKTTHLDIANDLALPVDEVEGLLFGVLNPTNNEPLPKTRLSVIEPPAEMQLLLLDTTENSPEIIA